jgi:hypothetical protein
MRRITSPYCERSEYSDSIQKRLAALGFNVEKTGGNCTALVAKGPRGSIAVTSDCSACINAGDFRERVVTVGVYRGDSWDSGDPELPTSWRYPKNSKALFKVIGAALRAIGKKRRP